MDLCPLPIPRALSRSFTFTELVAGRVNHAAGKSERKSERERKTRRSFNSDKFENESRRRDVRSENDHARARILLGLQEGAGPRTASNLSP